jgi:two-component system phosphate regulon sensor histidine kinase PhoR
MFTDKTPPEQWQNALPTMRQQAERMSDMLAELLTLSRLETGEKALQVVPTDVRYVLQEIIEDAKKLTQYNNHDIQLVLKSEHWLLADTDELRSAISNLVFNAVNYTPAACKIVVSWAVDEQAGVISVCDEGEGIADHHLERLTERFYRVDSGRSQNDGGTGLGLAIVKYIIQRHDAVLKISSELGHGSRFECCFPLSRVISKPK